MVLAHASHACIPMRRTSLNLLNSPVPPRILWRILLSVKHLPCSKVTKSLYPLTVHLSLVTSLLMMHRHSKESEITKN